MATARARAVNTTILGTGFAALALAMAPSALAVPNCTGDGTANTCVLDLTNLNEEVDAAGGTDTLVFNAAGLTRNSNTLGTTAGPLILANFEEAFITAGSDLTLTGGALDATSALAWTIDAGGSLFARGGNAIHDGSPVTVNGLLEIGGGVTPAGEAIGSLAGSGSVALLNAQLLIAGGNGQSTAFSGVLSGDGSFTKVGGGTLTLSGANTFTGALSVTNGILEIAPGGSINSVSGVTTAGGGQLTGTTPYAINAAVTNNGRIAGNVTINSDVTSGGGFLPGDTANAPGTTTPNPGQLMGQITINGNYTSTGASSFVGMFVDIDAAAPAGGTAGVTHDFFTVVGNASGTPTKLFTVDYDDAADIGGPTSGNGIQVVRITGTSSADAFYQGNALNAGAYQYLLRYVPDYNVAGDDGFFLVSAHRDELVAHPALLSAGQALIRHCFRDDQRVPDSPKGATYGRAWVGYRQGSTSFGADTGIEMDEDFSCQTGGLDWRMGSGWFGGVSGGFGDIGADLVAPSGNATLDGTARAIEAYASFTSSSLFVNLSAGYADMDWIYRGALMGALASSSGFIGQAQAGVALGWEPLAVRLIASLNYDGVNCGENCMGLAVTEDTGLIEAKAGIRIDGVTFSGSVRPWAALSYSDVLSDGINTVAVGGVGTAADTNGELLTLDAGLLAYLDQNLAFFADGGYHESLGKDISGYKAGAGFKLYW